MKKLDPRIKDRKYIFDCFNAEEAKKYIGQKCYMTDFIERFDDIENTVECTLENIDGGSFVYNNLWFAFCLPAEFVAPNVKAKTWRPYTRNEMMNSFIVGHPITFRKKGHMAAHRLAFGGYYAYDEPIAGEDLFILIGNDVYALKDLFANYEWRDSCDNWHRFGVEE